MQSTATKRIAFTFDDGPTAENTYRLLAVFKQEQIHVTFSMIASMVQTHADAAKAIVAAGHEIANHSLTHQHPADLDDAALEHEILEAQRLITAIAGVSPRWYWPPFIEIDPRFEAILPKAGLRLFAPRGFVDSADWNTSTDAATLVRRATTNITDGTLIVFHEWRNETVDEMPGIVAQLKKQGCELLTFSGLATGQQMPRP